MPDEAEAVPGADQEAAGYDRWLAVLDELEAELEAAAVPGAGDADRQAAASWTAPKDLGPIPAELVDRATKLAAAQQEAVTALRAKVRSNRSQSAYLQAVPQAAAKDAAVYLDTTG
ncbi:hypothetical protein ACFQ36_16570 [Arthrobacter sp. GCM10027362]|uniref:hypothetical protein n=1 Tax=Arthrobacter sp. GCM10027362 TaxID=3273379 RepID=UPI00362D3C49